VVLGSSAFDWVGEALLRDGGSSCSVADSCNWSSATVLDGCSAFPSMTKWTSGGRVVEAERNSRILETVCTGRTLSLMAGEEGIST
jgi:hypothetical protein